MLRQKILLIVGLILAFSSGMAQSNHAVQSLERKLVNIHTLRANFKQVVVSTDGTILQQSQGLLAIKRPDQFRWQTLQPLAQLIIANGDKVLIYDKGLQQLTIRKLSNSISQTPILLLSSPHINLRRDFKVTQKKDGSYLLMPRQTNPDFKSMQLWFTPQGSIRKLRLHTNLNQQSSIQFSAVKQNHKLASSLFIFQAPSGVDTINEYSVSHDHAAPS